MCVLIVPASNTYATDAPSTEYYNVQYGFSYEETVMPTNQIVRKYENPTSFLGLNNTENSVTKTKTILGSLGMGEDFIDELSTERLNEYANSKSITVTTSYIKTTPEGISTYVTKEDAENGSRAYDPPAYDCIDDGGGTPVPIDRIVNYYTPTYRQATFIVSKWENAVYSHSLKVEWLTMPINILRFEDLISIVVDENTVIPSSTYGRKRYILDNYEDGELVATSTVMTDFESSDFVFCSQYGWQGYAVPFDVPRNFGDILSPSYVVKRALNVKLYFETEIKHPAQETTFLSQGTYSQTRVEVDVDLKGGIGLVFVQLGVYIDPRFETQNTDFMLNEPIKYVP